MSNDAAPQSIQPIRAPVRRTLWLILIAFSELFVAPFVERGK